MRWLTNRFRVLMFPELAYFRGHDQRIAIKLAERQAWKQLNVWLPFLIAFVIALSVPLLLPAMSVPLKYRGVIRGAGQGVFWGISMYCLLRPYRENVRRNLRNLLNLGGPFICVECGYSLKEIESHTCPECGAEMHSVGREPR